MNVSTILRDVLMHKKILRDEKANLEEKNFDEKIDSIDAQYKNEHLYFRGESQEYKKGLHLYIKMKN